MTLPLTPADADLQDFPYMPLHVARLRDSDLAAEGHPEGCWYAVLLWSASWHQLPAGSLPDNDTVLMRLVGLGRDTKTWAKHKADALRGWVRCDDGRLYHSVVAEEVHKAWTSKLRRRWSAFSASVRKHNERDRERGGHDQRVTASFEDWLAMDRPETITEDTAPRVTRDPRKVTRDSGDGHTRQVQPVTGDLAGAHVKGEGEGEGEGYSIDDVVGGAGARSSDIALPSDLISLTERIAIAGGIRNVSPGPIIANQGIVREWLNLGAEPDEIVATIAGELEHATERISSLRYFDRPIRQAVARRENRANGSIPDPAASGSPRPGARHSRASEMDDAAGRLRARVAEQREARSH